MRIVSISAAALAVCFAASRPADAQTRYGAQPGGTSVKIAGTSSLHDWEMEGTSIGGFIEFGPGVSLDKAEAAPAGLAGDKVPAKGHVIIPVGSIHSKADHLPEVMDGLMQKNMKAADFPRIEFTLKEMTFKGPHASGTPFNMDIKGDLVIAGKANEVSFPVTVEPLDGGAIKVSGSAPVKMTDYGVDPPTPNFGLGMMKCGDDVKIIFDWKLKKKQ